MIQVYDESAVITAPDIETFRECVVVTQNGIRMLDKDNQLVKTATGEEGEEPDDPLSKPISLQGGISIGNTFNSIFFLFSQTINQIIYFLHSHKHIFSINNCHRNTFYFILFHKIRIQSCIIHGSRDLII